MRDAVTLALTTVDRRARAEILLARLGLVQLKWDYIFVCNLLYACSLFDPSWFDFQVKINALDHGPMDFIARAKRVSDTIKTIPFTHPNWNQFVENGTFSGYRNAPFPGFDMFKDTFDLANSAKPQFYPRGETVKSMVAKALPMAHHRLDDFLDYPSYVRSQKWLTAGSSMVGKVTGADGSGEKFKFRAKKNMLPYLYSLDDLVEHSLATVAQDNRSFLKPELGKLRIAVSSDVDTYLKQSYLNYLLNGAYKDWPGSTIEETAPVQADRMLETLKLLHHAFGLPFDYLAFDHQPELEELEAITAHLTTHASLNVPDFYRAEWARISANIVAGMGDAYITANDAGRKETYRVKSGVMSGYRLTTVMGNAWNTLKTAIVENLLTTFGIDVSLLHRWIRGDDTAVIGDDQYVLLAFSQLYSAIGVDYAPGKFSIRRGAVEFLRVWYSDRAYGYPARALPGLTQRKAWASEPWSPVNTIVDVFDSCSVLQRRGVDSVDAWSTISRIWLRNHRLPRAALTVPKELGGYGVEPWDGSTRLTTRLPFPTPQSTRTTFDNLDYSWPSSQIKADFEQSGIAITLSEAETLARDKWFGMMASDDVPQIAASMRSLWNDELKVVKAKTYKQKVDLPSTFFPRLEIPALSGSLKAAKTQLGYLAPTYGLFKHKQERFEQCRSVARLRELPLKHVLKQHFPEFYEALRPGYHLSNQIDWLFGNLSAPLRSLHPMIGTFPGMLLAATLRKPLRSGSPAHLVSLCEHTVSRTSLAWYVFQW